VRSEETVGPGRAWKPHGFPRRPIPLSPPRGARAWARAFGWGSQVRTGVRAPDGARRRIRP